MVTGLEVYHADPLGAPQLHEVAPSVIRLIGLVGLAILHSWYQQQRTYAPGLLVWQDWTNNPHTYQFVKVDIQTYLLLRVEVHGMHLNANLVPEL